MYGGRLSAARSLVAPFKTVDLVTINHTAAPMYLQICQCVEELFFSASGKISIVKPTRFTNVSNLFYFGMTLYIGTSCWFYYRNNIMIHGPMNVKLAGKMFKKLLRRYFLTFNELPVSFAQSRNSPQVVYIQEKFVVWRRFGLWNYI